MRRNTKMKKMVISALIVLLSASLLFSQTMSNNLRTTTQPGSREGFGLLPATDPYLGTVTVKGSLPENMVDWVLVELRATADGATVGQAVGCLLTDGSVTDTTGTNGLEFADLESSTPYYIVVKHRNHLDVMSSTPVTINEDNSNIEHDFTLSGAAYGGNGLGTKLIGTHYAMFAGDGDANGQIQTSDKSTVWVDQTGQAGYKMADFDMNGFVQTTDKSAIYQNNVGKASQIPVQ